MATASASASAIPAEFTCPLTMELMTDPVTATDGTTYERTVITDWLSRHTTSPVTNEVITATSLIPNVRLYEEIARWRLTNEPIPRTTSASPLLLQEKTFNINATNAHEHYALTVKLVPANQTPMETALIAVIDVSGSMGCASTENNTQEGGNFTRLDLVKHSMKTLAHMLNSEYETTSSSLSIVTFSTAAQLVMPLTQMDNKGLSDAIDCITRLRKDSSTNIWDGLRIGLQQAELAASRNPNANIQILLLTDGEPTSSLNPPLGIKETLQRKLATLTTRPTISTFGFGYELDSQLMEDIAVEGNGSFGFIPDCSMVGTVFINWTAKALLTLAHHLAFRLPDGQLFKMGDIIKGKSQMCLIPKIFAPSLPDTVELLYDMNQITSVPITYDGATDIAHLIYIDKLINTVTTVKQNPTLATVDKNVLHLLHDELATLPSRTPLLNDILKDINSDDVNEGQLLKATSNAEWYTKWGRNHCIAYTRALILRQCINFKDRVVQHFASDEFKALQERGIEIFSDLPAPVSKYSSTFNNGPAYIGGSGVTTNMSAFVSQSGGCFTGNCRIKLEDGSKIRVDSLRNDDTLWGGHKIRAIIYTRVDQDVNMIKLDGGLTITPWHPIKDKDADTSEWVFPHYYGENQMMYVENWYNLVLETGHIAHINGREVATLGHDFTDNDVIRHPYFGTQAVIEDLKGREGWEKGFVRLDLDDIIRDKETGMIQNI
jgi:Mg-chelatase subunit ChlD